MPELALIERIASRTTTRPGTTLGIGDDAAILDLGGSAVVTHDMLVAGVHFRLSTTSPEDLGWKAVAVNLSDLAAMGVVPVALVVGLALPAGSEASGLADALTGGIEAAAAHHGVTVAGGDVTSSPALVIGITAIGRPLEEAPPVRRTGALPGDLLCVTGSLGASWAGLVLLEDPDLLPGLPDRDALVAAHRRPTPRIAAGQALARGGARAMLDVSDGLVIDAGRLARASGAGCRIALGRIPLAPGVAEVAEALGRDPWEAAATAGEGYELLAAVPPARVETLRAALDLPFSVVGEVVAGEQRVDLHDEAGNPVTTASPGWEHDV